MRSIILTLALELFYLFVALAADVAPAKVDQIFSVYDKAGSPGCTLGVIHDGQFIYRRAYSLASLELGVPLSTQSVFCIEAVYRCRRSARGGERTAGSGRRRVIIAACQSSSIMARFSDTGRRFCVSPSRSSPLSAFAHVASPVPENLARKVADLYLADELKPGESALNPSAYPNLPDPYLCWEVSRPPHQLDALVQRLGRPETQRAALLAWMFLPRTFAA